jgi:hypothetical protein
MPACRRDKDKACENIRAIHFRPGLLPGIENSDTFPP